MTDPRWEALRKAAQGLLKLIGHGKGGPFKPDPGGTYNERVEATFAALAALEEPAPAYTGYRGDGGPVGRCAKTGGTGDDCAACCNIGTDHPGQPKELLKPHTCDPEGPRDLNCPGCSQDYWGTPNPIQRNSMSVSALSEAPDREALVAEVAALRAEVEEARRSHSIALHEGERFRRERDAAEAALAAEQREAAGNWRMLKADAEKQSELCRSMFNAEKDRADAAEAKLAAERETYDRAVPQLREYGDALGEQQVRIDRLEAALATERARALEEAVGFEGHPPGVCLEHDRFRLEGAGLVDADGGFDRCTGCGQLPPHAGCRAICAACAPPNGTCYCAGCQVAGKASPPPAPAAPSEGRCPEPRWFPESDPPINPGWYAVQRKDGSLCLRAFGNDEWWIPLKDGWLSDLPPGFRWLGPLEPVEWDTPRSDDETGRAPRAEGGCCDNPAYLPPTPGEDL